MLENISGKELIAKVVRWRKTFLIVSVVSILSTGVIVFLLPKQYKSTAILFAARQFSVSKLLIEPNIGNQNDYIELGDEDDCEKLIQILISDALKIKVANAFDLWKRWKIKDTAYAYHFLKLKWEDMVKVKRTEFNSIKIEVYDYTANGAAQIANAIGDYSDSVRKDMNRVLTQEAFKVVKFEYDNTVDRIKELEDSLQTLRNIGVLHYKEQVKAYSKSYAKAVEKNDVAAMKRLEEKLDTLQKYGGAYQITKDKLDKYMSKYPDIKMKYDEAIVNINSFIPAKFVLEKARPNEYKAKPLRVVIVAISLLACNIFALFVLLMRDSVRAARQ